MKFLSEIVALWVLGAILCAPLTFAVEKTTTLPTLVLKDESSGKYFYLAQAPQKTGLASLMDTLAFWDINSKYVWVPATEAEIRTSVAGINGHFSFRGGEFRLDAARRVLEFRSSSMAEWHVVYKTPTDQVSILRSFLDGSNNMYVQLDGPGISAQQGFFLVRFSGTEPENSVFVPATWQNQVDLLSEVTENPYEPGLIVTSSVGYNFDVTPIKGFFHSHISHNFQTKPFKKNPNGKVVSALDGMFGLKKGKLYRISAFGNFQQLRLPEGVKPGSHLSIRSSTSFRQGEPEFGTWRKDVATVRMSAAGEPAVEISLQDFLLQKEQAKLQMRESVLEQYRYTDALVDLWWETMLGGKKRHRSILVTGPTGTGKSFGAEELGRVVLKDPKRVLVLDMTKFQAHEDSLDAHTLFGSSVGTKGQENFQGILPMFLRGRGKGKSVIVFNELEKAAPHIVRSIMEMVDNGKLQAGDGKIDELGQSLLIFTSNKGSEKIYPRNRKAALSREEIDRRLNRLSDKDIKEFFLEPDLRNLNDTSKVLDPEFLQRIDRAVPAAPLSYEGALKIVTKTVAQTSQQYSSTFKVNMVIDDSVLRHIVDVFYVPEDGVRAVEKATERIFSDFLDQLNQHKLLDLRYVKLSFSQDPETMLLARIWATDKQGEPLFSYPAYEHKDDMRILLTKPEERSKITGFEQSFAKHVFGQQEAIRKVARGIRSRKINAHSHQPMTALFLGPTGVGKTELGKALAKEAYGDGRRFELFDMGVIKEPHQLNNLFNSSKGYEGSGTMTNFERVLHEFPEGAVIMFDEISNMGRDLPTKHNLLMAFYTMIQEGSWTSSQGKVYDLSKFCLIFSGNDLQDLFMQLPSDDLRVATWEQYNKKELLTELLIKHYGWPQALLGRFKGNITLFKPITADVRRGIAEKMVQKVLQPMVKYYFMDGYEVSPDFYQIFGDAFFSHSFGARSIEGVVDEALVELAAQAILASYDARGTAAKSKFVLSVSDSYQGLYKYKGPRPPERSVKLTLKLEGPDFEQQFSTELASETAEKRLSSVEDLRRTSFHEAGHAVVNDPLLTGEKTAFITVKSAGFYGGYARYVPQAEGNAVTRNQVVARIGRLLAGRSGEMKMGFAPSQGWQDDLDKAKTLAFDAVVKYGLTSDPLSIPKLKGEETTNPIVQSEVSKLLHEGKEYASKQIDKNWLFFRLLSAKLLRDSEVTGDEIEHIRSISVSSTHWIRFQRFRWFDPKSFKPSNLRCMEALIKNDKEFDPE